MYAVEKAQGHTSVKHLHVSVSNMDKNSDKWVYFKKKTITELTG